MGGFSAAARALHVTKSSLSKRVARLEGHYGARLIERSTRGFRITAIGRAVHAQCEAVVAAAEGAATVAAEAIALPRGMVRVACPPGLLPNILTPTLPRFMAAYPEIRLALAVSNRRVDLVEEGFDVAIRVRERLRRRSRPGGAPVGHQLANSRRGPDASGATGADLSAYRSPSRTTSGRRG